MVITAMMTVEQVLQNVADTLVGEGLLLREDTRIMLPPQRAMLPWTDFLGHGWTPIAYAISEGPVLSATIGSHSVTVEVRGYDEIADTERRMTVFGILPGDIAAGRHHDVVRRIYELLGA